jgi:hypothetical protein
MKYILIFMAVIEMHGISFAQENYYEYYNVQIVFDGEKKTITRNYLLRISEDVAINDYRYNAIYIPYDGGIDEAKILVKNGDKILKKYTLEDAVLSTHNEDYVLVSDNKYYSWDLGKLTPGTSVEYNFISHENHALYGDYEPVMGNLPIKKAEIKIIIPISKWQLKYSLDNQAVTTETNRNVTVLTWLNLTARADSEYKNAPDDILPGVWYVFESKDGTPDYSSWNGVYRWHQDLYSENIGIRNQSIFLKIANTPRNIIEAINKECRYVAVEIGLNKFKPEIPDLVWQNRYGDCKGLANLFITWMKLAGYQAWPVLVLGDQDRLGNSEFPSPYQFNHQIAGYISESGDTAYHDLTDNSCPIGYLPRSLYGKFAFPLIENANPFRLGYSPEIPDTLKVYLSGEINGAGTFGGLINVKATGASALSWTKEIVSIQDLEKNGLYNNWLESLFPGARFNNISEISAESVVCEIAANVTKTNFCYQKGDSLIARPWGFTFADYDKAVDTGVFWPIFKQQNTIFLVRVKCFVPQAEFCKDAVTNLPEIPQWLTCKIIDESKNDSLSAELALRFYPATIQPDKFNEYNNYRALLANKLKKGIVFIKNK